MKSELFLKERYVCNNISYQKINCSYWSQETKDDFCNITCSLKQLNPNTDQCYFCKERNPLQIQTNKTITRNNQIPLPEIEKKSFMEKAVAYGKAEASQFFNGKVPEEVYLKRKNICLSCDFKTNPKPETESIGWCKGGCGCKVGNPRAALSEKLYIPTISCPKQKFGYEKGVGFNTKDAVDAIKGVSTSIIENAKSNIIE